MFKQPSPERDFKSKGQWLHGTSELFSSIKWLVLKEVNHEQAILWGLPASSCEGGCATTRALH